MKMEILDLNNDEDTKTTDEMEPKKPEEKTSPVKEILSWVLTIAFAIVAAILIKNYVIINANIPSGSMENTIQIGDDIFGFRLALGRSNLAIAGSTDGNLCDCGYDSNRRDAFFALSFPQGSGGYCGYRF